MSLIGMTPTITATRTIVAPLEVGFGTNINLPTAANLTVKVPTATTPTSLSDVVGNNYAGSRIVVGSPLNYAKIQSYTSASGATNVVMHVIGWNRSQDGTWRPQLITTCSITNGTVSATINGSSLFPGLTYVKNFGDCKIYNGNTAAAQGGFIIVDVCGAELLEIAFSGTAATTANALIGYI
jgi:hypothetical protein